MARDAAKLRSPITMAETNPHRILPGCNFVCELCGMDLTAKLNNQWADGYEVPEHIAAFLVEHAPMPQFVLDLDMPVRFCPNNGKRFFVSYSLTVLQLDIDGKPIPLHYPLQFKPLQFSEVPF